MEVGDRVLGADQLIAVFGYWPSFHDAEVIWLRLDRRPFGDGQPTLEAMVHAFEITSEIGTDGCYVLRHHVLVHLRFRDVVELRLEGFNHQNALMRLGFEDLRDRQWEHIHFGVRFDSAFGVHATFQCHSVEVLRVESCTATGEPIAV